MLVDYEGDSAATADAGKLTALPNSYNSISINKVKGIVWRKPGPVLGGRIVSIDR